jgi:hypothetical protein
MISLNTSTSSSTMATCRAETSSVTRLCLRSRSGCSAYGPTRSALTAAIVVATSEAMIFGTMMLGAVILWTLQTSRPLRWVFHARARRLRSPPPLNPRGDLGVTLDYSFATAWPYNEPRDPEADIKRSLLFMKMKG